jgi:hypothetical protein
MRRTGVLVYTTVESRSRIGAQARLKEPLSTRVLIHEVGDVVDEAGNNDEVSTGLFTLLFDYIKFELERRK